MSKNMAEVSIEEKEGNDDRVTVTERPCGCHKEVYDQWDSSEDEYVSYVDIQLCILHKQQLKCEFDAITQEIECLDSEIRERELKRAKLRIDRCCIKKHYEDTAPDWKVVDIPPRVFCEMTEDKMAQ